MSEAKASIDSIESLRAQLAEAKTSLVASEARVEQLWLALRDHGVCFPRCPEASELSRRGELKPGTQLYFEAWQKELPPCTCGLDAALSVSPSAALKAHTQAVIRKALEEAWARFEAGEPNNA